MHNAILYLSGVAVGLLLAKLKWLGKLAIIALVALLFYGGAFR